MEMFVFLFQFVIEETTVNHKQKNLKVSNTRSIAVTGMDLKYPVCILFDFLFSFNFEILSQLAVIINFVFGTSSRLVFFLFFVSSLLVFCSLF